MASQWIRTSLLLDRQTKKRLQGLAKKRKIAISPLIRYLLNQVLDQEELKARLSK